MNKEFKVIGLMSGTSLDGLDIALCTFNEINGQWKYSILNAETISYDDKWNDRLKNAHLFSSSDLLELHIHFGKYCGEMTSRFIHKSKIKPDLISSHGHTVFHEPAKKLTLQIGAGEEIASVTGITTINNFRTLDVALGGQGAPLVPIGDELLFTDYDACLNLGGFANISFRKNNQRFAFDICPVNMALNFLSSEKGFSFDRNGDLGKRGNIIPDMFQKLNNIEFYHKIAPKSLGREWFDKFIEPIISNKEFATEDRLSTIYNHICFQISKIARENKLKKILVTGGGAFNTYLMDMLNAAVEDTNNNQVFIVPDSLLVEYKEALIFAFLGLLRYQNRINCLSSVTGAKRDSSCGNIHLV